MDLKLLLYLLIYLHNKRIFFWALKLDTSCATGCWNLKNLHFVWRKKGHSHIWQSLNLNISAISKGFFMKFCMLNLGLLDNTKAQKFQPKIIWGAYHAHRERGRGITFANFRKKFKWKFTFSVSVYTVAYKDKIYITKTSRIS